MLPSRSVATLVGWLSGAVDAGVPSNGFDVPGDGGENLGLRVYPPYQLAVNSGINRLPAASSAMAPGFLR